MLLYQHSGCTGIANVRCTLRDLNALQCACALQTNSTFMHFVCHRAVACHMPEGLLRSHKLQCLRAIPHCKEYACVSRHCTLPWSSNDCIIISHTPNMCAMRCFNLHMLSNLDWLLLLAKDMPACYIMVRCLQSCTCRIATNISHTKHLCHAMLQPLLSIRR